MLSCIQYIGYIAPHADLKSGGQRSTFLLKNPQNHFPAIYLYHFNALILSLCIAPPHIKIEERTTTFFFFVKIYNCWRHFRCQQQYTILTAKGGRIWYISPAFGFFRSLRQQQFTTWMHRVIKLLGNSHNTTIIQFVSTAIPTTQVELK